MYNWIVIAYLFFVVPLALAQNLEAQVQSLEQRLRINEQHDDRRDVEIQEVRKRQVEIYQNLSNAFTEIALSKQIRNVEYAVIAGVIGLFAWALKRLDAHTTKLAELAQSVLQHDRLLEDIALTLNVIHDKVSKIESSLPVAKN